MNIGHLEKKLLKVFRKKYACDWDNTGLLVGDAKAKVEKIAYNLLERFGIVKTKADRLVGQLSGGEQQRVAIARSLASNVDL